MRSDPPQMQGAEMDSPTSSEAAITVTGVSKSYNIYVAPQDRLKQAVIPRLQDGIRPFASVLGFPVKPRLYYRQHWALRDISLTVRRGETVGIIGRNGSGKSTLLQLICGTLMPSAGDIQVSGRVGALLELGAGFNPENTGRENVYLNASVLGLTHDEITAKLDDILAFADIGPFIEEPVKTYSSGMAMRLAFAVMAHIEADILLIDEALAVGDAFFQQKCIRWLRRFRETGTVLFCGHDTGAVLGLCDHAIWLDQGQIEAQGLAKEVCDAYLASISAQAAGHDANWFRKPKPREKQERKSTEVLSQDVSVFEFNEGSSWHGSGDATILDARMTGANGSDLSFIRGGEPVQIVIRVRANKQIGDPIIGFFIKDRLGQALFGDNTYHAYRERNLVLQAGEEILVRFEFDLPLLMTGEYAATVAIASGTLEVHVQHHWLHDAFTFQVTSPLRNGVLLAIPMHQISIEQATTSETVQA
jgi:lipopolysaccharide transport system ATP-binding protein